MLKYVLLIAVGLTMAQGLTNPEKRSLASTLSHYGQTIHDVAVRLGRHLHNDVTVGACAAICQASAKAVLEEAAGVANVVCHPCVTTFKMLKYLLLIAVVLAMAEGLSRREKRSLATTLSHFGHSIHDVAVKLGRHLHNGVTVAACTRICKAGAAAILEAAAPVAWVVCHPLCDYVLDHAQTYIVHHTG